MTAFYNDYDNLRTEEAGTPYPVGAPPQYLLIPLTFGNLADAESFGGELSAIWDVTECWKLSAGYSYLRIQMHLDSTRLDMTQTEAEEEGVSPRNQFHLRSYVNLSENLRFDTISNYVDNLPHRDIRHYTRLDQRLGWRINESVELSIIGQNLFDSRHIESHSNTHQVTELQRSLFAHLIWRF